MIDAPSLGKNQGTGRWELWSFAIGVLALVVCIVGSRGDLAQLLRAYLPAWLFYWGLALGSMAVLMIYHLIGGAWGFVVRRIVEAAMRTLPLTALLFLPIALGMRYIYPFAQQELVDASAKLQHQTFYLTPQLFWIRAVVYFILWLAMAYWLGAWSKEQDQAAQGRLAWKCEQLSAFGAVVYGVTLHFAAIDWAMSLQPAFHSTIWGPLFAMGQLLSALALASIVLACLLKRPPLAEVVSRKALGDLGSLMLTFLIAWAYMAWFQFMLIWIANLPVDIIYYLSRLGPVWLAVIWAIVVLHFVVPFFLLLMRPIKRRAGSLAATAGLLLFMQLVYMYYQITPMFAADVRSTGFGQNAAAIPPEGGTTSANEPASAYWMDLLMPVAVGGIWLSHYLWQLRRRPLLVEYDSQRAVALRLRELEAEEAAREEAIVP